jgi:hypothetical protein
VSSYKNYEAQNTSNIESLLLKENLAIEDVQIVIEAIDIHNLEQEMEKKYSGLVNDPNWKELKGKMEKQQMNNLTNIETSMLKHKLLFEENKALKELLKVYFNK